MVLLTQTVMVYIPALRNKMYLLGYACKFQIYLYVALQVEALLLAHSSTVEIKMR